MGKRKSAKAPQGPKKREPLAVTFACLFCNHENSVGVKLYKKEGIGQLACRICGVTYSSTINYLSAAVDVYSDWIDACEAVKNNPNSEAVQYDVGAKGETQPGRRNRELVHQLNGDADEMGDFIDNDDGDDLDGFIENDERDMDAGYKAD